MSSPRDNNNSADDARSGEQPGSSRSYACPCGHPPFALRSSLLRHQRNKHSGLVFGCMIPGLEACAFASYVYHSDLLEHIREVHGIEPPPPQTGTRTRTPDEEIDARKRELCARCRRHLSLGTKKAHEATCADFARKRQSAPLPTKRPAYDAHDAAPAIKRRPAARPAGTCQVDLGSIYGQPNGKLRTGEVYYCHWGNPERGDVLIAPPIQIEEERPAPPIETDDERPAPPAQILDAHPSPPVQILDERPAPPLEAADVRPAPPTDMVDERPGPFLDGTYNYMLEDALLEVMNRRRK